MHRKVLAGLLAMLIVGLFAFGMSKSQTPLRGRVAGCDTINTTVTVGLDYDSRYAYFWLTDSASAVGQLFTYWDSSVIETCSVHLYPGDGGYVIFAPIDSFRFVKADSADKFCYSIEW